MFLDHIFFYPPDGRRPDGQGKNIMTLKLRWAGHKNCKETINDQELLAYEELKKNWNMLNNIKQRVHG